MPLRPKSDISTLSVYIRSAYRVAGYTLEYDTRQGIYRHHIDLCGV
jgi:hypothetical protein